jgi:hypothetical protein
MCIHKNHISNIFFPIVYQKKNKLTQHNYQNYRLGQTQALGDSLSYFYLDDEIYLWDHKQFMRDGFYLAATSLASKAPFWRAILNYTKQGDPGKFDIFNVDFTPLDICKDKAGTIYVQAISKPPKQNNNTSKP